MYSDAIWTGNHIITLLTLEFHTFMFYIYMISQSSLITTHIITLVALKS